MQSTAFSIARRILPKNSFGSFAPTTTRSLSSFDSFQASTPAVLTPEMAEGIGDMTQFYVSYGVSHQRLAALSREADMSVVLKWQKMMEIFLTTQVHVIAGLGYTADEQGLTKYAQDLANCLQGCDPETQEVFRETRRDTWRELVATAFDLDAQDIPTLSIVDARNIMHQVSSRMVEDEVLLEVQNKCAKISHEDAQMEVAQKHTVLQDVIVNSVYLGGSPSIVEQSGFGCGAEAYAKFQCAMSDHEGDPLIAQYVSSSMMKIWNAAGMDLSSLGGPGLSPTPGA